MPTLPDHHEKRILLEIARHAMTHAVQRIDIPSLAIEALPASLQEPGASFVTLTIDGNLRGCIGSIEAVEPLAADVQRHAVDAALSDPRFPPVQSAELDVIQIEISVLTEPVALESPAPADRVSLLRPGIDGVILRSGPHRSTFLPQVWEKLTDPEIFLEFLCQKAYLPTDAWKKGDVDILIYQVMHFDENSLASTASR